MLITSRDNPKFREALQLRESRVRRRLSRFVIDGVREIATALDGGVRLERLFVREDDDTPDTVKLVARCRAFCETMTVTASLFERLAFGERDWSVVAVAVSPSRLLSELVLPASPLIAVIEGVEKPGNVGAVFRSADAAGLDAVIVAAPQSDLDNPAAIRASLGTVFTVPSAVAASDDVIAFLRERNFTMMATRCDATTLYHTINYDGATAIILGSESQGLSAAWHADDITAIRLPMHGRADSLNISATAAAVFYHAKLNRGAM
ncbi:MAG: TrmH family RNA methyltransferase [Thermoguttaceae bacterium]